MMVAGAICLITGLAVLAYSARDWAAMKDRVHSASIYLEDANRMADGARQTAEELDRWSEAKLRLMGASR
jgi:hypothetical protein